MQLFKFRSSWLLKGLLLAMLLPLCTRLNAQSITLQANQMPLKEVLKEIGIQSGKSIVFKDEELRNASPVTVNFKSVTVEEAMAQVFKNQPFKYEFRKGAVIIKKATAEPPAKITNGSDSVINVRGKLTNENGEPVQASIIVKRTGQTFMVKDAGNFEFRNIQANDILEVHGVTIESFDAPVQGRTQLALKAKLRISKLDEVEFVYTGYQTLPRERSTGSFGKVNEKQLNKQINTDLLAALEGQVAGLNYIKNPTGSSADKPVIRGASTFSFAVGTDPLMVIDGLPTTQALSEINPYNIESVTVLKDAAALSIYGSRAANGVIVLTTKQAKGNGTKVNANADLFITPRPSLKSMHYASTSDLIDYETDIYNYDLKKAGSVANLFASYGDVNGTSVTNTVKYYSPLYQLYRQQAEGSITADQASQTLAQWRNNDYYNEYRNDVWQNEMRQRYNISVNTAGNKGNTFMSVNYDASKERVRNVADRNLSLYLKTSYNLAPWLTISVGANGTFSNDKQVEAIFTSYLIQPRYARIKDDEGNLVYTNAPYVPDGLTGSYMNPLVASKLATNSEFKSTSFNILESLPEGTTTQRYQNLRGFAHVQAKLIKGLTYSAQFQYETANTQSETYNDANSYRMRMGYNAFTSYNTSTAKFVHNVPVGGRYYQVAQRTAGYTFRHQLNLDRSFGYEDQHSITAIAGFEARENTTPRIIQDLRYGYDAQTLSQTYVDVYTLNTTGVSTFLYGTKTLGATDKSQSDVKHHFVSGYTNVGYTFQRKYNLTASVRVDQADLFGADPKYKYRPLWSIGAGWNASNEEFFRGYTWLSLLKLRTTYGVSGNVDQTSSPYLVARKRTDNLYPALQYTDITTMPNPKLRWEKTTTTNFGFDYALFANRVHGSFDIYNKISTDLLVTTSLDPTVGTSSITLNNGGLQNRGVEILIGSDWYKTRALTLSSTFVIGFNKTKVKQVNNVASTAYSYVASPTSYFEKDKPFNSLYAYRYGGMTNGYAYFINEKGESNVTFDANGEPTAIKDVTSATALVNMGVLTPTYNGSFTQQITYKGFELSAMLIFAGGNKLRKDVTPLSLISLNGAVIDEDVVRRSKTGAITDLPKFYMDYPTALVNSASTLSSLWQYADVQVRKADYVKLRNVVLSYNLPYTLTHFVKVEGIRVSCQADNLWYWSAAGDDIDPETYSINSGTRNIAIPKSFVFALRVNF